MTSTLPPELRDEPDEPTRSFAPPIARKVPKNAPSRTIELTAEDFDAPRARHFAVALCLQWDLPDLVDQVSQLVTELVTNAIVHTHKPLELSLTLLPDRVRVAVSDHDANQPARTRAPVDALRGRGLRMVAALSLAWGVTPRAGGKTVWAEVPRT